MGSGRRVSGSLRIYLFALPEPLPVPHGSTWAMELDLEAPGLAGVPRAPLAGMTPGVASDRNFVSLRFWQVKDEPGEMMRTQRLLEPVVAALTDRPSKAQTVDPPPMGAYRTVVEAVTFVSPDDVSSGEDTALTRCVDVLLQFHRAYRIAERARIPELTYERLPIFVLRLERPVSGGRRPRVLGVSILDHTNTPGVVGAEIDQAKSGRINQIVLRARHRDPLQTFADRRLDALVEAQTNGRFGESVVQVAIAAEVFLDAILGLMMWEEALGGAISVGDAASAFSRDLTPRLRNEYSSRLGGDWSLTGPNLLPWERDVASVRNRVVHGGYRPGRNEAADAMNALTTLEHFAGDRLAKRFASYHRTGWMFLGAAGFERRGRLKPALKWADGLGEPIQQAILRWSDDYWGWREQVNAQVQRRRRS